jgi:uncharacterized protein YoxC
MTDKKKNIVTSKIEELQTSVSGIIGKFDELKDLLQKNVNDNVDKIKELSQNSQEKGKKYIDSVMGLIPFKNYYDKIKENDYTKLAITIKTDLEGKFNVSMDQLLNAFSISSTMDTKELLEKIEKLEKNVNKVNKDIKKIAKETKE